MGKILYIAPVRDFSGYANAARGYIRALKLAGADLVVRPVRYDRADSGSEYKPTDLEKELLKKPLGDDIKVVIQHTTPNEMRPVEGRINIAITAWETTRIPDYWAKKLNQFDHVITFCDASVKAFRDCGVTAPITKVPHTFDISSYSLDGIESIQSPSAPDFFDGKHVFYNISQLSAKKGIDVLLRAYYAQFHGSTDVVLILKTYIDMSNRQAEREKIQQYINSIKHNMRLSMDGYPPVMLITKTLTDEQIKKLHKTGNTYVCSSRAEGWCIPAFEALTYGNKLVTTQWGGMGEFAVTKHGSLSAPPNVYPVNFSMEPLVGQGHGDPELYTAHDLVAEPSVSSMMSAMQTAKDSELPSKVDLMEFDYQEVGPRMLELIAGVVVSKEAINV